MDPLKEAQKLYRVTHDGRTYIVGYGEYKAALIQQLNAGFDEAMNSVHKAVKAWKPN